MTQEVESCMMSVKNYLPKHVNKGFKPYDVITIACVFFYHHVQCFHGETIILCFKDVFFSASVCAYVLNPNMHFILAAKNSLSSVI